MCLNHNFRQKITRRERQGYWDTCDLKGKEMRWYLGPKESVRGGEGEEEEEEQMRRRNNDWQAWQFHKKHTAQITESNK